MTEPFCPPTAWLRRVQALLTKAESTEFPDKAEALLTKAQELMARHAIDEAMVQRAGGSPAQVESVAISVSAPYASARSALLSAVARANDCRAVLHGGRSGPQNCTVVGHRSDLEKVQALFAALSMHATRSMLAAAVPSDDTPRRFRHAFLLAFASRVGERLRLATRDARSQAETAVGSSVALALRERTVAVDEALASQFPRLGTVRWQASSAAGMQHGRAAADGASLGHTTIGGRLGLPGA